jgi:hypothetical protein
MRFNVHNLVQGPSSCILGCAKSENEAKNSVAFRTWFCVKLALSMAYKWHKNELLHRAEVEASLQILGCLELASTFVSNFVAFAICK